MPIIMTMEFSPETGQPGSAGGESRPTILVIDDEPAIRKSVGRLLERADYLVRTAATGDEAMALVRSEHFDAAICDLHIPGVNAVGLCEQIWLAAPDLAGRLIVASGDLTGDGVEELVERTRVPPVSKPFTAADLLRAVGAICPAPSPAPPTDGRMAAS
jgi:DNA-binding NtrC family response regulator